MHRGSHHDRDDAHPRISRPREIAPDWVRGMHLEQMRNPQTKSPRSVSRSRGAGTTQIRTCAKRCGYNSECNDRVKTGRSGHRATHVAENALSSRCAEFRLKIASRAPKFQCAIRVRVFQRSAFRFRSILAGRKIVRDRGRERCGAGSVDCQQLVAAHGGAIHAKDAGVGQAFTVRLPLDESGAGSPEALRLESGV